MNMNLNMDKVSEKLSWNIGDIEKKLDQMKLICANSLGEILDNIGTRNGQVTKYLFST